jgi:hypothetical protein
MIMGMLHIAEINMANTISESEIVEFLANVTRGICSAYHNVLKASPGAATLNHVGE